MYFCPDCSLCIAHTTLPKKSAGSNQEEKMKHLLCFTTGLAMAALALGVAARPAQAQLRIAGGLSNFDCGNETEGETEGFEIEIEDDHKDDVIHTWNYSAFGAPTVEDGGTAAAPTVIIRYHSATAVVPARGVTHFGVSLKVLPPASKIHYRWLLKSSAAVPNPPPVPVPLPNQESKIVYTNGVPAVQDVIRNTEPDGGKSFWVLPIAHMVYGAVPLEDLMADNPVVTDGTPEGGGTYGDQPELLAPGDDWTNDDTTADSGDASLVYTFQIFEDVVTIVNGKTTHAPGAMIADMMNATITASGPVGPNLVSLTNGSVYGVQTVTGTVYINGNPPANGMVVNLASSDPAVQVPASVTVLAGHYTADFTITTRPVAILTNATITASAGNGSTPVYATLTVQPPLLTTLYLQYAANYGGTAFSGSVYIISPAPAGGTTIFLYSANPAIVSVPGSVTVPAGQTSANFPVQTYAVTAPQFINISARLEAVTLSQSLRVNPAPLISGVVTLEGCVSPAQSVTLEFRPASGTPLTRSVTLSSLGAFSVSDAPPGKYSLAIKGSKWLQQVIAVDSSKGPVSGISATLLAGDANNDNSVDATDFGQFVSAYNTSASVPGSGYDPACDFNCDGSVDATDFGLLVGNYGQQGDN